MAYPTPDLHLHPDDADGFADDADVTSFTERGGNSYTVTGPAGDRPKIRRRPTDFADQRACFDFLSSERFTVPDHANIELNADSTLIALLVSDSTSGNRALVAKGSGGGPGFPGAYYAYMPGTVFQFDRPWIEGGVPKGSVTAGQVFVVALRVSGTTATWYKDGSSVGSDTIANGSSGSGVVEIGTLHAGSFLDARIAELLVFNSAISLTDLSDWTDRLLESTTSTIALRGERASATSAKGVLTQQSDHVATQWELQASGGDWSSPTQSGDQTGGGITEYTFSGLTTGNTYELRARRKRADSSYAPWSYSNDVIVHADITDLSDISGLISDKEAAAQTDLHGGPISDGSIVTIKDSITSSYDATAGSPGAQFFNDDGAGRPYFDFTLGDEHILPAAFINALDNSGSVHKWTIIIIADPGSTVVIAPVFSMRDFGAFNRWRCEMLDPVAVDYRNQLFVENDTIADRQASIVFQDPGSPFIFGAFSMDKAVGRVRAYEDSAAVAYAEDASGTTQGTEFSSSEIGGDQNPSATRYNWVGRLYRIVVYNRELTQLEVAQVRTLIRSSLLTEPPTAPGAFLSPLGGEEVDASLLIEWTAATDPEMAPLQYLGEWWNPDTSSWTSMFPLQSGLTYNWNTTLINELTGVKVRVRAYDGQAFGPWLESNTFDIAHPFPPIAPPIDEIEYVADGEVTVKPAAYSDAEDPFPDAFDARRIRIYNADTDALVQDSGWQASANVTFTGLGTAQGYYATAQDRDAQLSESDEGPPSGDFFARQYINDAGDLTEGASPTVGGIWSVAKGTVNWLVDRGQRFFGGLRIQDHPTIQGRRALLYEPPGEVQFAEIKLRFGWHWRDLVFTAGFLIGGLFGHDFYVLLWYDDLGSGEVSYHLLFRPRDGELFLVRTVNGIEESWFLAPRFDFSSLVSILSLRHYWLRIRIDLLRNATWTSSNILGAPPALAQYRSVEGLPRVRVKLWRDDQGEPASWQWTVTDTGLQEPGDQANAIGPPDMEINRGAGWETATPGKIMPRSGKVGIQTEKMQGQHYVDWFGLGPGVTLEGDSSDAFTNPKILVPTPGQVIDASVTLSWLAPFVADGSPTFQYEADYWDGSTWQVLFALATKSPLEHVWDTSLLAARSDYRVRIRAHDGSNYGPYAESDEFVISHASPATSFYRHFPTAGYPDGGRPGDFTPRWDNVRDDWATAFGGGIFADAVTGIVLQHNAAISEFMYPPSAFCLDEVGERRDGYIEATLRCFSENTTIGLVARATGTSRASASGYFVALERQGATSVCWLQVARIKNGVVTILAQPNVTIHTGVLYRLRVKIEDEAGGTRIQAWTWEKDNPVAAVGSPAVNVLDASPAADPGMWGVGAMQFVDAGWDRQFVDLSVSEIAEPPPPPEDNPEPSVAEICISHLLEWEAVPIGDGPGPVQYEGQYWDGALWQPLFALQTQTSYEWVVSGLAEGDYPWRIRATDDAGSTFSDWTVMGTVTVIGAVTLDLPERLYFGQRGGNEIYLADDGNLDDTEEFHATLEYNKVAPQGLDQDAIFRELFIALKNTMRVDVRVTPILDGTFWDGTYNNGESTTDETVTLQLPASLRRKLRRFNVRVSKPQFGLPVALTGTVALTLDSATVTGTGTLFLSELAVGDVLQFPGSAGFYQVLTIASDTSLTLYTPYRGVDATADIASVLPVTGRGGMRGTWFSCELRTVGQLGCRDLLFEQTAIRWDPLRESEDVSA